MLKRPCDDVRLEIALVALQDIFDEMETRIELGDAMYRTDMRKILRIAEKAFLEIERESYLAPTSRAR